MVRAVKIVNYIDDVYVLNTGHDAKYSDFFCGFPQSLQTQMLVWHLSSTQLLTSASIRVHHYFATVEFGVTYFEILRASLNKHYSVQAKKVAKLSLHAIQRVTTFKLILSVQFSAFILRAFAKF